MKLNYKRTVLVGFAFFLICAFWQIYDVTIAMTLTSKFGLSQTASGVVMALDNILALFMLPLFGKISDNHKGKTGLGGRVQSVAKHAVHKQISFPDHQTYRILYHKTPPV